MPQDHVELFRVKGVGHGLGDFFLCQMRQQVSYGEHRIAGVLAQHDLDGRAVLFDDHAVQCERPVQPLIFEDAAVVMGLEQS